jgi:acyl carrier protein
MSPIRASDVRPSSNLIAELGFDSLGVVELLVALEDTFDLPPVDADNLAEVERVDDLERIVREARARMSNGEGS